MGRGGGGTAGSWPLAFRQEMLEALTRQAKASESADSGYTCRCDFRPSRGKVGTEKQHLLAWLASLQTTLYRELFQTLSSLSLQPPPYSTKYLHCFFFKKENKINVNFCVEGLKETKPQ